MPFGCWDFVGREFDRTGTSHKRTVGRPRRDRRAIASSRRARRRNRRR